MLFKAPVIDGTDGSDMNGESSAIRSAGPLDGCSSSRICTMGSGVSLTVFGGDICITTSARRKIDILT